jgi:transcriptional regulator with XRE-family HTH domain
MLTTGNQLRAARALVGLEQKDVAEKAGVNVNTIRSMESAGAGPIAGRSQNVQTVQRVLEKAGIEFLNHGQPGVRLKIFEDASEPATLRYDGREEHCLTLQEAKIAWKNLDGATRGRATIKTSAGKIYDAEQIDALHHK